MVNGQTKKMFLEMWSMDLPEVLISGPYLRSTSQNWIGSTVVTENLGGLYNKSLNTEACLAPLQNNLLPFSDSLVQVALILGHLHCKGGAHSCGSGENE